MPGSLIGAAPTGDVPAYHQVGSVESLCAKLASQLCTVAAPFDPSPLQVFNA